MFTQIVANSLISACSIFLLGLGFTIVYSVSRFFQITLAAIYILAAYSSYYLMARFHSAFVSVSLSILFSVLIACLIEWLIYYRLRKRGAQPMIMLLASLCVYLIIQNVLSMCFSDVTVSLRYNQMLSPLIVFGARITFIQVSSIATCILCAIAVQLLIKKTRIGLAIRAVASDQDLSHASGIDCNAVILFSTTIAAALAAITGLLTAWEIGISPELGINALMISVVAALLGGIGEVRGVLIGSLLISFSQNIAAWFIGSEWQNPIVYVVLIIYLYTKKNSILLIDTK